MCLLVYLNGKSASHRNRRTYIWHKTSYFQVIWDWKRKAVAV